MSDFKEPLETVVYFDCSEDMADVAFGELYKFISNLPYPEKQIITNALGKLKLLEEQGCKVDFITVKEFSEECIKDVCDEFKMRMPFEFTLERYEEVMGEEVDNNERVL